MQSLDLKRREKVDKLFIRSEVFKEVRTFLSICNKTAESPSQRRDNGPVRSAKLSLETELFIRITDLSVLKDLRAPVSTHVGSSSMREADGLNLKFETWQG